MQFYRDCQKSYGKIEDKDISDEIFEAAALFEISLRMHGGNNKLSGPNDVLEDVINRLSAFKELSIEETEKLHLGRRFLNMIKHNKNQFSSWQEGITSFLAADDVLSCHKLTVI